MTIFSFLSYMNTNVLYYYHSLTERLEGGKNHYFFNIQNIFMIILYDVSVSCPDLLPFSKQVTGRETPSINGAKIVSGRKDRAMAKQIVKPDVQETRTALESLTVIKSSTVMFVFSVRTTYYHQVLCMTTRLISTEYQVR